MSSERIRERRNDGLLTVPTVWLEESSPMLKTHVITEWAAPINILLTHFSSAERKTARTVTIVNKLSGKALEVENSSSNQGTRIQQFTRNDGPNQRWVVKRTKSIKRHTIPGVIIREAYRYWPPILPFPHVGYSIIADHSGLCLDILNGSTDSGEAVQQSPENDGRSHLWAFVPDKEGFNFIVSLYTGRVLDVTDSSLKNYATVQHYPFNGADSQRWQLFS